MKEYIELLRRISEKEEVFVDEKSLISLAENLIAKVEVICGGDYGFQDSIFFTTGKLFADKKSSKKAIKDKTIEKLYIFIESIEEKVKIETPKGTDFEIVFVGKESKQKYSVIIDKRINCLMKDTQICKSNDGNDKIFVESMLYVAKVYDLVEIYNSLGDKLFDKNVRCKIKKDVTGVSEAILETLKNNPDQFWILNNGITMIADKIEMYKSHSILISCEGGGSFSVINGAQTISTCADFFFSDSYTENEKEKAKSDAYVILRMVSIKGNDLREVKQIESKISVSLNRQKPIDSEDLAYSAPLIGYINELKLKEEYKELQFKIAKKGEEYVTEKCYTLGQLGKLILAGKLQMPGSAKNAYIGNMLKLDGEKFRRNDIFNSIKRDDEKDFLENYGAVNLMSRIYDVWASYKGLFFNSYKEDSNSFLEGSNYYFVSIITWALLGEGDFCGEDNSISFETEMILNYLNKWNEKKEYYLMFLFTKLLESINNSKEHVLGYNDLKKNEFYNSINPIIANAFKECVQALFENPNTDNDLPVDVFKDIDNPDALKELSRYWDLFIHNS